MSYRRPDYAVARTEAGFHWQVSADYDVCLALAGVPIREFFLDPGQCAKAYRVGRPAVRELFGPDVGLPAVSTPPISYGHVNTLGCRLLFPEGGEVAHEHLYGSLDEGLSAMRREVDFDAAGMAPFYLDFRRQLLRQFPGEFVGLGYRAQGPMTTAYALRGEGIWLDAYDRPEEFVEFLRLVTASIVEHRHWTHRLLGWPEVTERGFMTDDLASMFGPDMFGRFVVPFWEQLFDGVTDGLRAAHVENLRPDHLAFLEQIGLCRFDPSISPQLDPPTLRDRFGVPFEWRLGSFHYRDLDEQAIRDWVFQAAADGASAVCSGPEACMCDAAHVAKVKAFIAFAKEAKRRLDGGQSRADLGQEVSPAGRARFWRHWPRP